MDFSDVGDENMAEAAVANPAARFFCHRCTQEISPVLPDFICPRCQSGFIEELAQAPTEPSDESDDENDPIDQFAQVAGLWNIVNFMRQPDDRSLNNILLEGREVRNAGRPGPSRRPRLVRGFSRRQAHEMDIARNRTEGFLQQLMTSLAETTGVVANSSFPVLLNLHSNPGDYAWGRGGWNAIITQLINQLDGTGPPPLPKDKIEEIPIVEISQEQVDKNLQCTVCMEDYKTGEPVRRLSCDHHFHNDCIIPWLELHGTCPICRKLLNDSLGENTFSDSSGSMPDIITIPGPSTVQNSSTRNSETNNSRENNTYNPYQPSVYDFTDEFD